jgi:hypothetical protein
MTRRNLTIQLPAEIDRLVGEDEAYEVAQREALADLDLGFDLGSGGRLPARDEVYDR